jgi:cysteine sulfinate desulfinase/cysteine desulfurase-like protein
MAMGVPEDRRNSSVRFSFGAFTSATEIDDAVRRIAAVVRSIAEARPLQAGVDPRMPDSLP